MGVIELFLTGVGLSMDAFAVAVCKGLGMKRVHWGQAFVIALFFGGFLYHGRGPLDRFRASGAHRREDVVGRLP